ncbi:FAR1-related sequence 5-like protein [Tanacetum coccineum]
MNDKRTTKNVKRRCIKRKRCNAMIRVKLSHDGKWVVEKFLDEHNHPFDIPSHVPRQWSHKSFHRSKECKDLVALLSKVVSIITEQDLAMGIAIEKVFPQTRHRYCALHIQKHVLDHLQPLRSRYDDFQDTYTKWVKIQNIKDYEAK